MFDQLMGGLGGKEGGQGAVGDMLITAKRLCGEFRHSVKHHK